MIRIWKKKGEILSIVRDGGCEWKNKKLVPVFYTETVIPSWGPKGQYWETPTCRYNRHHLWYSKGEFLYDQIIKMMADAKDVCYI